MNEDENHIVSAIEIELSDKAHASLLRQKAEEGMTEAERSTLEFTSVESLMTISGPEILLRRVIAALDALRSKE